MPANPIYGLMAQFATPDEILDAARRARREGYRHIEAFTPYSVEGLAEILGFRRTNVPFVVLVAGLVGAATGYFMMYWSMAVNYPFDVGSRPPNSWPAFIPITFEVMVLVASFAALLSMLFLNGLPKLHRPVFNVPAFERATQDRFYLCIESTDARFEHGRAKRFLAHLHPEAIYEVPH